jgi:archaellum component FlaC
LSESESHSYEQIGEELDRIEARLDDLLVRSDMLTSEINELAEKIKFYLLITESWTDEEDE